MSTILMLNPFMDKKQISTTVKAFFISNYLLLSDRMVRLNATQPLLCRRALFIID